MHLFFLFSVVFGLLSNNVKASSLDEMNKYFTSILTECLAENPVSSAELGPMTDDKMADIKLARCMFACAYKRTGMMDEEGKLSAEGVRKISSKYFSDDPAKMKISDEFTDACLSVNNETVTDGTKGCDRAVLIFECSVKKVPDFDLF